MDPLVPVTLELLTRASLPEPLNVTDPSINNVDAEV
jgi:hypothetical protein